MNRLRLLIEYLKKVNFFDDDTNDERTKRNQILSTRLYIILFIIILASFTVYLSLSFQTITVSTSKPNQNQYEALLIEFSNTLKCPCENIAVAYKEFVNVKPIYHEICSSDFVSQRWLDFLFEKNMSYYFQLDFRYSATALFQTLQTLCQQAQKTINDKLIEFDSLQLIASELISNKTFSIQTNSSFETFKATTLSLFQNLINLFRSMIINNHLLSAQDTNYALIIADSPNNLPLWLTPRIMQYYKLPNQSTMLNCLYTNEQTSRLPGGIYTDRNRYDYVEFIDLDGGVDNASTSMINATVTLPGILISCLPMESLLHSTLECFFNETCLNIIISYLNHSKRSSTSFSALNISRFLPETTVETLMNESFIEEWMINTSYAQYFNQCQPSFCQYSKEERNNALYIFTMIISLYGGLKTVLTFLIPMLITTIRKKRQEQTANIHDPASNIPLKTRLYLLLQNGIRYILKLNIFDSQSTDEYVRKTESISTKVYFIVLLLLLIVFVLFTSLRKQTKIISINNPTQTQFTDLADSLINNLQCPCSQTSIRYDKFITFQPIRHEVCSSMLVSSLWYESFYWAASAAHQSDFRGRSPSHFGLLKTLCEFTNITIVNSLTQFYANEYVTSQVAKVDIFRDQVISFIELFQSTTRQSFKQTLDVIRNMIFDNLLASYMLSNVDFYINNDTGSPRIFSSIIYQDGCSCAVDPTCKKRSDIQPTFFIRFQEFPGTYIACLLVESLLFSTLECYFDKQCIMRVKSYMDAYSTLYNTIKVIPVPEKSQYLTNTSIETFVDNLFIEDWNANYFYEKYYVECKPSYCSYQIQQRPEFLYILLKVIGIFGGLAMVLKFLVPFIVHRIRRRNREHQQVATTVLEKCRHLLQLGKESILNLNLFQTKSNNDLVIRRQRLTTKFYLIILIVTLIILILYTSLDEISVTETVQLNSRNQYDKLRRNYPNTLDCSCDQISTEYQKFIQINLSYHQICSSNFVTQKWIRYLYKYANPDGQNFRATAVSQFLTLSSLCELTRKTIETNIEQFYGTKFLTSQLISSDLFETQMNSIIKSFRTSVPLTFKRTLDTTRGLIQGNSLLTGYQTNWKLTIIGMHLYAPMYTDPLSYGNSCNCATSALCTQPAIITDQYPTGLPGLLIGCYPLEAILQSSLECLYDRICLDSIILYMNQTSSNITMTTLNSSLLSTSESLINETVEQMTDRLFIDQWYINRSYDTYYEQCASTHCTYSYIQTFDIFYIVTTILGLYGGLSTILKIIVPLIVYCILWILNRRLIPVVPFAGGENNLH